MFAALRRRAELKRRAKARADEFIARHGQEAWEIAHEISRDQERSEDERSLYYRVRGVIERRLGMAPRVDTATRHLQEE